MHYRVRYLSLRRYQIHQPQDADVLHLSVSRAPAADHVADREVERHSVRVPRPVAGVAMPAPLQNASPRGQNRLDPMKSPDGRPQDAGSLVVSCANVGAPTLDLGRQPEPQTMTVRGVSVPAPAVVMLCCTQNGWFRLSAGFFHLQQDWRWCFPDWATWRVAASEAASVALAFLRRWHSGAPR